MLDSYRILDELSFVNLEKNIARNNNCYMLLVGVRISTVNLENNLVLFNKFEYTHILHVINPFFKYVLEKFFSHVEQEKPTRII